MCTVMYKNILKFVFYKHFIFNKFIFIRADGVMRTMNTDKLLKTMPLIQNQMDALLDFNVSSLHFTNAHLDAIFLAFKICKESPCILSYIKDEYFLMNSFYN